MSLPGVTAFQRLYNGFWHINIIMSLGDCASFPIPSFPMMHMMNILTPIDLYVLYPQFTQSAQSLFNDTKFVSMSHGDDNDLPPLKETASRIMNKDI